MRLSAFQKHKDFSKRREHFNPPTQYDIPEDLHLSSYPTTSCVLIIPTLSAKFCNRETTRSDHSLEITGSGTDHTVLSFIILCLAGKFSFLSLPICSSQSCGTHAFFFRRTCFEVEGV